MTGKFMYRTGVSGWKKLKEHVRNYTPEWAAPETEIPAEDIRRMARELAAAAPCRHGLSRAPQFGLQKLDPD